jgi:hypothetical protein
VIRLVGLLVVLAIGGACREEDRSPVPRPAAEPPVARSAPAAIAPSPPAATAPAAPAPAAPAPAAREIGTVPWRLDRVNPEPSKGEKDWTVRLYLYVTRLRDVPPATELREKLSCLVGSTTVAEVTNLAIPDGPIVVGESAQTFADHFAKAKLEHAPARCELLVYAQMPGAKSDVIDHEVGRACIVPGKKLTTTLGACPPQAELPP